MKRVHKILGPKMKKNLDANGEATHKIYMRSSANIELELDGHIQPKSAEGKRFSLSSHSDWPSNALF